MYGFNSLQEAIDYCLESRQFSIALPHKLAMPMELSTHGCYVVHLTLAGGIQLLIADHLYELTANDLCCISPSDEHYVIHDRSNETERLVVFIHPDFIRSLSTEQPPLDTCFLVSQGGVEHKKHLTDMERRLFLFHINQLDSIHGYGFDILCRCRLAEFLLFLNILLTKPQTGGAVGSRASYPPQVREAINYINEHITEDLSLASLADHLYLSESYLCRIFKASTGTTIRKYIISKRLEIAKTLLTLGYSVAECQVRCGFGDYSNFLKAFTHSVGMSPKKYAQTAPRAIASSQLPDSLTSPEE